ncbi:unnamed protein product, partial [Symbiodinium microadriaticum]
LPGDSSGLECPEQLQAHRLRSSWFGLRKGPRGYLHRYRLRRVVWHRDRPADPRGRLSVLYQRREALEHFRFPPRGRVLGEPHFKHRESQSTPDLPDRLLRGLIRIVRLVRTVKALRRLRTMIFSILNSFVDLLWAIVVVILIIYIFSIIFSNAVALYFDEVHMGLEDLDNGNKTLVIQQAAEVSAEFGDLYSSILALWSAVSGGNDWMMYGSLLRGISHGELYFVIFNFYIAFCVIGMFNVVTGVFVDSAVCCRTEDEVVQGYIDDLRNTTREIKSFFQTADTDRSGTLTYEEFKKQLDDPLVKAYFSGLDIDPSEASIIFAILDADKSDELKIDEFVNGTMKLKGAATKLDVMTMMFDNTKQTIKFNNLCEFVEQEFTDIRKGLLLLAKSVQEVRTEAAAAIELSAASAASPPASPSAASPAPPETTAPSLLHEEDAESRRPRSGHPSRRKPSSVHRVPSSAIRVRPRSKTPDSRAEGE